MRAFCPIATLSIMLCSLPVAAQETASGVLFRDHCATCHGLTARGDGPMAAILAIPATDLTQLAAVNGGVFPLSDVISKIDGTVEVLAHGGPMPIFGHALEGESVPLDGPDGSVTSTTAEIMAIATWLASVQSN
ncbi:c-type cytochrome [Actibacterium lipolyticum]|uniref:Cytochrome c domain-containing protein n=1 Tax=Actibacterium lipolyticum TaxID=1524263 RepID=A0A238JRE7_9RHOB|nr:c-type cytochrome [Actibacterium lipolyticum]SMX32767.1 hypothetical protein COL8621_00890 [Actibacterium lipolyticum]